MRKGLNMDIKDLKMKGYILFFFMISVIAVNVLSLTETLVCPVSYLNPIHYAVSCYIFYMYLTLVIFILLLIISRNIRFRKSAL
ncbi:MAG: hypothetical protein NDI94_04370 [Candidatus Woesearchaeota archaeon]|nr:hypothetical protein [Candidatus Woesearchaeota archaeon]